jgi:hypothetical protein
MVGINPIAAKSCLASERPLLRIQDIAINRIEPISTAGAFCDAGTIQTPQNGVVESFNCGPSCCRTADDGGAQKEILLTL